MRVLYVTAAPIPSTAANSVQVMKMCQALARQGAAVTLRCRRGFEVDDVFAHYGVESCFEIRPSGFAGGGLAGAAAAMVDVGVSLLRGARPDLVYARTPFPLLPAAALGVRIGLELHAPPSSRRRRLAERMVFRTAPLVVAITDALRRHYVAGHERLSPAEILVAPDGADPLPTTAWEPPADRPFTAGFVGSFYPGRGIRLVLAVARRCSEVRFELIGGAAADVADRLDGPIPPNVAFRGRVPPREAHDRLVACDVLLAPYQPRITVSGGGGDTVRWFSPIKIFEYMASGRAILSSDLPVLHEVLEAGRNAMLLPPEDPDVWAEALRRLQAEPGLGLRLASEARRDLEQKYAWDVRARRILDFARERGHL